MNIFTAHSRLIAHYRAKCEWCNQEYEFVSEMSASSGFITSRKKAYENLVNDLSIEILAAKIRPFHWDSDVHRCPKCGYIQSWNPVKVPPKPNKKQDFMGVIFLLLMIGSIVLAIWSHNTRALNVKAIWLQPFSIVLSITSFVALITLVIIFGGKSKLMSEENKKILGDAPPPTEKHKPVLLELYLLGNHGSTQLYPPKDNQDLHE